jgi:hypothetical protein
MRAILISRQFKKALALIVEGIPADQSEISESDVRDLCNQHGMLRSFMLFMQKKQNPNYMMCLKIVADNFSHTTDNETLKELFFLQYNLIKQIFERILFDRYSARRTGMLACLTRELFSTGHIDKLFAFNPKVDSLDLLGYLLMVLR